jgi:hypothetical protein
MGRLYGRHSVGAPGWVELVCGVAFAGAPTEWRPYKVMGAVHSQAAANILTTSFQSILRYFVGVVLQ